MENVNNLVLCSGAAVVALAIIAEEEDLKKRRRRTCWRQKLYDKKNGEELLKDLKFSEISGHYQNFLRMSSSCFETLLNKSGSKHP